MTTNVQMIDLGPAAQQVTTLVAAVRDDQLAGPTPCANTPVGDLLGHLVGLTLAFRLSAEKAPLDDGAAQGPPGSTAALPPNWRELDALVAAWRDPAAWEGETTAGGVTMPAAQMGVVALDVDGIAAERLAGRSRPDGAATLLQPRNPVGGRGRPRRPADHPVRSQRRAAGEMM